MAVIDGLFVIFVSHYTGFAGKDLLVLHANWLWNLFAPLIFQKQLTEFQVELLCVLFRHWHSFFPYKLNPFAIRQTIIVLAFRKQMSRSHDHSQHLSATSFGPSWPLLYMWSFEAFLFSTFHHTFTPPTYDPMTESEASTATIEVNDAVFCSQHHQEVVSPEN